MKVGIFITSLIVLGILVGCFQGEKVAGGGTEIPEEASIAGRVLSPSGDPLALAQVRLRPSDYLPDTALAPLLKQAITGDTVSDEEGWYVFTEIESGDYTLEILVGDSLGSLIQLSYVSEEFPHQVPDDTVIPLAEISGYVQVQMTESHQTYLQLQGTERQYQINSSGAFTFKAPQGSHTLHIVSSNNQVVVQQVPFNLENTGINLDSLEARPVCHDYACDSNAVQVILDLNGIDTLSVADVSTLSDQRIIALDLSNTGLDSLPDAIEHLSHLQVLNLTGNQLVTLTEKMGEMVGLSTLDLSHNALTHLPESITSITHNKLPDEFSLNVDNNALCNVSLSIRAWLDQWSPGWEALQACL